MLNKQNNTKPPFLEQIQKFSLVRESFCSSYLGTVVRLGQNVYCLLYAVPISYAKAIQRASPLTKLFILH